MTLMKLHYFQASCALAPHITLEWAGADYELSELKRSDTRTPEFLQLNPAGKVPVLELDDGRVLTNVNPILMWIAENSSADLPPEGPDSPFPLRRWLAHFNGDVHPAFTPYFLTHRFADSDDAKEEIKAKAAAEVAFQLKIIDDHLEGQDWMLGDQRSILDPYLFVFTLWASFMPGRLDNYPNLKAFNKRMKVDEGVQKALKMQGLG